MINKSISILLLTFLLSGCIVSSAVSAPTVIPSEAPTLGFLQSTSALAAAPTSNQPAGTVDPSTGQQSDQQVVLNLAFEVVNALKAKDMGSVSQYVHPLSGLRFSPYSYVKDTDLVFQADKVAGLMQDNTVYPWGNYDGSGEPINLTFADYYARFVYDVDFANAPELSLNHRLGTGNSIDNSEDFYPGAMIVEFHFPGLDAQYNGMDWRSLRLVFMKDNQSWYLAGIIHDQWTS